MPNKRALIVDDSTTAQYRLKKMLRPYELDIDSVDSGEAALRYLATNIPDVIFMDHLMPGMDGFRALQIIKSHPETAMIPVIMYTSKSGDVYTGQARALGALDVVSKDSINAADLSNVMRNIHIYRTDENKTEEAAANKDNIVDTTEKIPELKTSITSADITHHSIERKTPNATSTEQARNLELRLSHMEHTLEDSRRFITERVVRELQSLKQNIKQEFHDIAEQNHAYSATLESAQTSGGGLAWSIFSKLLLITPLILISFYLFQMNDALTESQRQQEQLNKQLKTLATQPQPAATQKATANTAADVTGIVAPIVAQEMPLSETKNYLADIAWTFNQTASIPFNQNDIDTKVVIRLYELLDRLISNGFKGRAWINIYVGNFCLATDSVGQVQLVSDNAPMGNCMLSSEVYGIDRLMEQYAHDVEIALNGLNQKNEKNVHIVINTMSEPDNYPERKATLPAKNWNNVAQNHNRIELSLEPKAPEASPAAPPAARPQ